jgi:hypothetical protein
VFSYRSDKHIHSLKGITSVTRPRSKYYVPPPPLPADGVKGAQANTEAASDLGGLLQAIQKDEPFKGLRLTDPEDSVFGNPLQVCVYMCIYNLFNTIFVI